MGRPSSDAVDKALALLVADMEKLSDEESPPKSEIDQLAQEADKLELALQTFQHQVKTRIAVLRRRHNHQLPISRLPTEILLNIFREFNQDSLSRVMVPIILMGVSSSWYNTCLFEASLWCHLSSNMTAEYIRVRLERSGNAPLHIKCFMHRNGEFDEERFIGDVIDERSRWKTFFIKSPYSDTLTSKYIRHRSFPMLEELTVYPPEDNTETLLPLRIAAPSLKHLISDSFPFPLHVGRNYHSNLREISLIRCTQNIKQFALILASSPNLENIRITENPNAESSEVETYEDTFDIQLPNLRTLELSKIPWEAIRYLLSSISTSPNQSPQFSVTAIPYPDPAQTELLPIPGRHNLVETIRSSEWLSVTLDFIWQATGYSDGGMQYDDDDDSILIIIAGVWEGSTKKELLHLELKSEMLDPAATISPLITSGCFSEVKNIEVTGIQVFEQPSWPHSSLPSLEVLRVRLADAEEGLDIEGDMQLIIKSLAPPEGSAASTWPYPQLRHVAFGNCLVKEDSLLRLLSARCNDTKPTDFADTDTDHPRLLELVEIEKCEIAPTRLEALAFRYNVEILYGYLFQW